jgi:hypothetical protein
MRRLIMEPTKNMDREQMLVVCAELDDAKWRLDVVTDAGKGVLDDFELGQVYAAMNIVLGVAERFYKRNVLDRDKIWRHIRERRETDA